MVANLERLRDRETDGAVHWSSSCSRSTEGIGITSLPAIISRGILLLGKSRKKIDSHREIDRAVRWSSLFPKLRRDFEREGARTISDSQWLGHMHRESNKPRFRISQTRTTTS